MDDRHSIVKREPYGEASSSLHEIVYPQPGHLLALNFATKAHEIVDSSSRCAVSREVVRFFHSSCAVFSLKLCGFLEKMLSRLLYFVVACDLVSES